MQRKRFIEIIDGSDPRVGRWPGFFLNGLILLSAISISLETMPDLPAVLRDRLRWLELVVLLIFALEYLARVICAPRPLRYMFSFWGIIDLLAILPLLALLNPEWLAIRVLRLLRLIRLLKLFRTSRALDRLARAFTMVKGELIVFAVLTGLVMYVAAVGIYVFEHPVQPEAFSSIPKSLWWAVASLTTVGYGDLVPITLGGRIFTALVLFVGLGVVAGPAAIVTTALLEADKDEAKPVSDTDGETSSNRKDEKP